MDNIKLFDKLLAGIRQAPDLTNVSGLFGFDGYVDDLFSVVYRRSGINDFEVFTTLEQFSDRIRAAIKKSADHVILRKYSRAGGNAILGLKPDGDMKELNRGMFEMLGVEEVVFHMLDSAIGCKRGIQEEVPGFT